MRFWVFVDYYRVKIHNIEENLTKASSKIGYWRKINLIFIPISDYFCIKFCIIIFQVFSTRRWADSLKGHPFTSAIFVEYSFIFTRSLLLKIVQILINTRFLYFSLSWHLQLHKLFNKKTVTAMNFRGKKEKGNTHSI